MKNTSNVKEHYKYNINFIDFPEKPAIKKGCYLIGDVYVGSSENIRKRILGHISKSINTRNPYPSYRKVYDYINKCLTEKIPIDVMFLSADQNDEEKFYKQFNIEIKPNTRFYKTNERVYEMIKKRGSSLDKILVNKKLSLRAKAIYAIIDLYSGFPVTKSLIELVSSDSPKSVELGLKELYENGYITRQ